MNKFSIITVCRNEVKTIERTINSVLSQPYECVEYIVIDGASTDGTVDIIKKYENRIAYWVSEPDGGVFDAMNKGIKAATGDVIAFMNSNDWYEDDVFGTVARYLQKSSADILYGRVNRIKNEEKIGYVGVFKEFDIEELYVRYIFCHQGMFIRKSVFDEIGLFDLRYKACSDYEWALRAVSGGKQIELMPVVVANFRLGGVSSRVDVAEEYLQITSGFSAGNEVRLKRIQEIYHMIYDYDAFGKLCGHHELEGMEEILPADREYLIWGTGDYADDSYRLLQGAGRVVMGFIDNYPRGKTFYHKKIYSPEEIPAIQDEHGKLKFVIGSSVYEREIIDQLRQMSIQAEYISFRDILRWIGEYQKRLERRNS